MSKLSSKQLIRTLGLLLAGLMLFGGGCSRRPRQSALPRPSSVGFSRVNSADTAQNVGRTGNSAVEPADVVSNTPTALEIPSSGEAGSELEEALAAATEETLADGETEAKPVADKAGASQNRLRRLLNWKNDTPSKIETPEYDGDENDVVAPDGNTPTPNPGTAEEPKPPLLTRGQRLLSMLRFPWGNEESGDDTLDGATNDSELENPDGIPELGPSDEELADGAELAEDPGEVEIDETDTVKTPVIRGPQPWSKTQPPAEPTGVSNQAIATLADFNFDESTEKSPETRTSGDVSDPSRRNPADRLSLDNRSSKPERLDSERSHAPADALRRAIFPESLLPDEETYGAEEPVDAADQPPVAVVKIPNRLPAPEVRGIARAWQAKLANRNSLLIASVAGIGLLFAWGIWRRARARDEV